MLRQIEAAFEKIPTEQILSIARGVQGEIVAGRSSVSYKDSTEIVTQADIEIQRVLLEHFARSSIAGMYRIKAEEACGTGAVNDCGSLQLVIDPLDGTNPFVGGESLWGTMVGVCDSGGVLRYSWNLLSDGTVYCSSADQEKHERDWGNSTRELVLDLFDYGAGVVTRCAGLLGQPCRATSVPSAVWSGWKLLRGQLDGLLWLSSSLGKGCYPDYDLVFLGALASCGFRVALGRSAAHDEQVLIVAVAPCHAGLERLWSVGVSVLTPELQSAIRRDDELRITTSICEAKRETL